MSMWIVYSLNTRIIFNICLSIYLNMSYVVEIELKQYDERKETFGKNELAI